MNKLSRDQLNHLEQHIRKTSPHQALQAELLDHMASLIEQRMDQGHDFPVAFNQVMQQANPQVLAQLKQLYLREFPSRSALLPTRTRVRSRLKRRPATKPFQYMLISSVLTFLILMVFLFLVSRPLAIPVDSFKTAWGAALAAFLSVIAVRWVLTRTSRKPKQLRMA